MDSFEDLISQAQPGLATIALRAVLRIASWPYSLITALRNKAYDYRVFASSQAPIPIISIGNLTVGGTGKTPTVDWLCTRLEDLGHKVAVLSRGYGARPGELNDEGRWLASRHPQALILQSSDRRKIAAEAAERGASIAILDDGFQHRKLARSLDWLLVDASRPFGYDAHLPRGLLREHPRGLSRADAVFISRAEILSEEQRRALEAQLHDYGATQIWTLRFEASALRPIIGRGPELDPHWLADRRIYAACGLGNPKSFLRSLELLGADILGQRLFPDHFDYRDPDLAEVLEAARACQAEAIVMTEKDAVKIARLGLAQQAPQAPPLYALGLAARCEQEVEALAAIQSRCSPPGSPAREP